MICGRGRELIWIREIAALHRIEQIRCTRILEERATWMRENGFDRIEVKAEMHEETLRRLLAGFDPKPCYSGLHNPRRPSTHEEFTLDMKIEEVSSRLEVPLLQPLPLPQYDLSPRR